jgi:hypothetical protein
MPNVNRTEPQTPATSLRPGPLRRSVPESGAGRLGVISGIFQLSGIGATLQALTAAAATIAPRIVSPNAQRPFGLLIMGALLAFGFFRTSHLLDQRRRSGAQLAALSFLMSLAGVFTMKPGLATFVDLGVSAIGLGLVASVWKHLGRD